MRSGDFDVNIRMKHLQQRNQTYGYHLRFAMGAGWVLMVAAVASMIHAIFPDLLVGYSERKIQALARLSMWRHD